MASAPKSLPPWFASFEASGVEVEWEEHVAGQEALDKFGKTLPDELLESIKRNKVGLKGPITTPVGKGFTSVNVGLRKALDLDAEPATDLARCRMFRVAIQNWIWWSCAKTLKAFTRDWSTRSFPAWSRALRSLLRKLQHALLKVDFYVARMPKSQRRSHCTPQSELNEDVRWTFLEMLPHHGAGIL